MRHRSGDRNVVGGDRRILDRGYGYLRRGDRYTLDRWIGSEGQGGSVAPPSVHLLNSLAAYYKLDEASGNRLNSAATSAPGFFVSGSEQGNGPGIIGNASYNAGTGVGYLTSGTDHAIFHFPASFTIAGWVKFNATPGASGAATIFGKWGGPPQIQMALFYYDPLASWVFAVSPDGTNSTNATIPAVPVVGQWYYVVGWYDAVAHTNNIQVNNGPVTSVAFAGPMWTGSNVFETMQGIHTPGDLTENMYLDEVALWSRVLNASERTQLYNGGAGWPFSSFTS